MTATTMELLDGLQRHLASHLTAAGFELAERAVVCGAGARWIEYRRHDGAATHLLSLTITSEGELLAEFWSAATPVRGPEVLERAQWPDTPESEAALLSAVADEIERWLARFADQRPPSL